MNIRGLTRRPGSKFHLEVKTVRVVWSKGHIVCVAWVMAGKLIESLQSDLPTKAYRVASGLDEALHLVSNEPSLGMYRIQEHIQVNVPKVVDQRLTLAQVSFPPALH